MLQWAASLHAAQPSKKVERQAVDAVLAQGWLDLPKEDETSLASGGVLKEVWVRHWFLLRNTVLNGGNGRIAHAPSAASSGL